MSHRAHGAQLGRVLRLLVEAGVVDGRAALEGRVAVTDLSRSNPVGLVHVDGRAVAVIKGVGVTSDGIEPIGAEAAAYRWLARDAATAALAPSPLLAATGGEALVTQPHIEAVTLHEALASRPAAAQALIVRLGRLLGILHGAAVRPGDLPARRPWILGLAAGEISEVYKRPEAAASMLEAIAESCPLMLAIAALNRSWTARTAMHGDVKFDNVLVGPGDRLLLIDWELAGRGEPAWDLAGVVDGQLLPRLLTDGGQSVDATSVARLAAPVLRAHRAAAGTALTPSPPDLVAAVAVRLAQTATQLAAMGAIQPDAAEAAPVVLAAAVALARKLPLDAAPVAQCAT